MTHKQINTLEYSAQLADKQARLTEKLSPFMTAQHTPPLEVFASPVKHYRMRAEFRVWHEGDDLYYIMFDPDTREKIRIDQFLPGAQLINQLMTALIDAIKDQPQLRTKLFQVDFLTTTTQQAIISLLYHRQLDEQWEQSARQLQQQLTTQLSLHSLNIIGRARKQKRVLGSDAVTERVSVNGHDYDFLQVENSFTQPNAAINQQMIGWAQAAVGDNEDDLLELYCGNGNFTLPLASQFGRVLATEISKSSVAAARHNADINAIDNVTVVRMSAEEFSAAMNGELTSRRAQEANIHDFDCRTVLVDPPRAGLDPDTLALVQQYDNILYISCNPDTLCANLAVLTQTHQLTKAALFDQFPYTEHMEAGVYLTRRR
ncbi:tRNA (uridine(54)-C5)-methyltransferase TrmA [Idiomarina xiamenensis]|uniref:tRNA/tmRNA (uracil-C(5))-methyltransferase n=1 Tax=Idiomarina xiamenensis 10-D-4 TaxID=740709 RepID=K2KQ14_9GAMM|nr:tRNA (uridine(54)-C5)-methyltransferase TrmA [Idiomarina xiamenensis]EKE84564.1 tRNA (uracil-5-)-methyltransferase [Idiomarina xiamenensis 10-D-4]